MMLLTKANKTALLPLGGSENVKDPVVQVKLFTPDSGWTWYVIEYDGEDRMFGYVESTYGGELGYFSITEIQAIRGPFGLPVERDRWFTPAPLSSVKEELSRHEELNEVSL